MTDRPKIVASIEARMGSSRLPGKSIMPIAGKSNLLRVIERLQASEFIDDVVVATSIAPDDEAIERVAKEAGVQCYRGSEDDVLNRVVEAHRMMESDIIVEITGDSSLVDAEILDMGIETFLNNDCDVVTNVRDVSFPLGIDIQVFPFELLAEVDEKIKDSAVREHVSLYFYENPDKYNIIHLYAPKRWCAPDFRFMLDYKEDHEFLEEIYKRLEPEYGSTFGLEEVMSLLRKNPELLDINKDCVRKAIR